MKYIYKIVSSSIMIKLLIRLQVLKNYYNILYVIYVYASTIPNCENKIGKM